MPSDIAQRIPISVLTGFLGSGKTTTLNELIKHKALSRTLVLINEFGEIGLDHHLVAQSEDAVVVEMSSGCLCCTIRGDLAKTLREAPGRFARGGERWFDRVVIETTGLADPAPILHTLMTDHGVARRYRLDGVITTVDAVNGDATLDHQIESVKQAAMADRLLLTKSDLVDIDTLEQLRARLRRMNPAAPQIVAEKGAVDPALLFDAGLYDPTTKSLDMQNWLKAEDYAVPHDHDHDGNHGHGHGHDQEVEEHGDAHHHHHHDVNRHAQNIKAFCLRIDEPVSADVFDSWLQALLLFRGADCLRIKGIVNVAEIDGPMVIHGVQYIFHPPIRMKEWPDEDRRSRIVFITRDIDESDLRKMLNSFIQTETERVHLNLEGDHTRAPGRST
jgi:G3E family GTPase